MQDVNRQVVLARRPKGYPIESDFDLIETPIPKPNQEEILVRTIYLSVDPYMRGRMNASRKSYAPPVEGREVITGGVVGEVIESKSEQLLKDFLLQMFIVGSPSIIVHFLIRFRSYTR